MNCDKNTVQDVLVLSIEKLGVEYMGTFYAVLVIYKICFFKCISIVN